MVAGLCIFISFISFHVLLFHLITFLIPLFPFISLCLPFCKHFKGSFLPDLFGFSPGPPLAGATPSIWCGWRAPDWWEHQEGCRDLGCPHIHEVSEARSITISPFWVMIWAGEAC